MLPLLLCLLAAADPAAPHGATLERDAFVRDVVEHHPSLAAMRHEARAADLEARAAAPPDPMLGWSLAPLSLSGFAPFGQQVDLSWRVDVGRMTRAQRGVGAAEAAVAAVQLDREAVSLAAEAREAWGAWWWLHQALAANDAHRAVIADLSTTLRARLAVGAAAHADVLSAELEAARVDVEAAELTGQRAAVAARLQWLRGGDPAVAPPPPGALAEPQPTMAAPVHEPPSLTLRHALRTAAEAELAMARRSLAPELDLMTSYNTMWHDPEHRWMAGVGVSVPVGIAARRRAVEAASARVDAAADATLATERQVEAAQVAAAAELDAAWQAWRLHRDRVVPLAGARRDAVRAAWSAGQAPLDAVWMAERDWLDAQLAVHAASLAWWEARAEWELSVGLALTEGEG